MDVVQLIGRVLFVGIFLMSGAAHLTQRENMVAYARSMGGPAPHVLVPLTGLMILAGGVLIAFGIWPDLGALLLAVFLLPTAYYMHAFWKVDDPEMRQMQQAHFMKNLSMFGAALALFALYAEFGDEAGLQLVGPLF